jgi:hypothetical protein
MTNALTIATMPVKANEKLTSDARNKLIKIVEQEFNNKQSLYHQIEQEASNKVIAAYHKKVGFDKLAKKLKDIELKVKLLNDETQDTNNKIWETGLSSDGTPRKTGHWVDGIYINDYEAKELNTLLRTIENNGPTQNLKNKLVTRITLASTIGEANVIMREILGNGLIPTLKEGDIK